MGEGTDLDMTCEKGAHCEFKACPRCGATMFEDMSVCYGCLYDFDRGPSKMTADVTASGCEGFVASLDPDATLDFGDGLVSAIACVDCLDCESRYAIRVCSGDLEVECPVFPTGMSVGRESENDIVIRNRAVSREHLMLMPTESGVLVSNLGATNPASVDGSLLFGEALLNPGQSVDVCGVKIGVLAW